MAGRSVTRHQSATVMPRVSGLAVSTSALAFAGDGHDDPNATKGFGVLYSTNSGANWIDAAAVTRKLVASLSEPYRAGGHTVHLSASVGISLFPNDGVRAADLIRRGEADACVCVSGDVVSPALAEFIRVPAAAGASEKPL